MKQQKQIKAFSAFEKGIEQGLKYAQSKVQEGKK